LGLQTFDGAVDISALEVELLLKVLVARAEQLSPVGRVELFAKQVLHTFALAGELSRGLVDDGDVGEIDGVGVDGVAGAMPEDFVDVDEFACALLV